MLKFIRSRGSIDAGLPFSDAVRAGKVLYLSGALGNVPGKMELVPGGIAGETRQMFQNIARTLEQNALSFDDVFKCTVMMADMSEWRAFNAIYLEYFKPDRLPSRSAFGAAGLALGARVEMECWAWAAGGKKAGAGKKAKKAEK
jgi:reactive intermediate/imine deaminase